MDDVHAASRGRERWLFAAAAAAVALLAGFAVGRAVVDGTSGPTAAGIVEYDGTLAGPDGAASTRD